MTLDFRSACTGQVCRFTASFTSSALLVT